MDEEKTHWECGIEDTEVIGEESRQMRQACIDNRMRGQQVPLLGRKQDRMRGWKRHGRYHFRGRNGRSKKDTRLTRLSLPYNLTNVLWYLSLKIAQRVADSDSKIQNCVGVADQTVNAWQFETLVNSPVAKQYLTFSRLPSCIKALEGYGHRKHSVSQENRRSVISTVALLAWLF